MFMNTLWEIKFRLLRHQLSSSLDLDGSANPRLLESLDSRLESKQLEAG